MTISLSFNPDLQGPNSEDIYDVVDNTEVIGHVYLTSEQNISSKEFLTHVQNNYELIEYKYMFGKIKDIVPFGSAPHTYSDLQIESYGYQQISQETSCITRRSTGEPLFYILEG